jgi:hypothetical protein
MSLNSNRRRGVIQKLFSIRINAVDSLTALFHAFFTLGSSRKVFQALVAGVP